MSDDVVPVPVTYQSRKRVHLSAMPTTTSPTLKVANEAEEKGQKRVKPTNTKVQTFLDLGQRNWMQQCPECGTLYSPGVDDKIHKRLHKQRRLTLKV